MRYLLAWTAASGGRPNTRVVSPPPGLRSGAFGRERWVAHLVDAVSIREATLFPRDINRLTPPVG
jgi:hypothetical protein